MQSLGQLDSNLQSVLGTGQEEFEDHDMQEEKRQEEKENAEPVFD